MDGRGNMSGENGPPAAHGAAGGMKRLRQFDITLPFLSMVPSVQVMI